MVQHDADWVTPFPRSLHSPPHPLKFFHTPPSPLLSFPSLHVRELEAIIINISAKFDASIRDVNVSIIIARSNAISARLAWRHLACMARVLGEKPPEH